MDLVNTKSRKTQYIARHFYVKKTTLNDHANSNSFPKSTLKWTLLLSMSLAKVIFFKKVAVNHFIAQSLGRKSGEAKLSLAVKVSLQVYWKILLTWHIYEILQGHS